MDPHRIKLTLAAGSDGGGGDRELPLVLAVIGDFAGDAVSAPVSSRRFVDITAEGIDTVMADIVPALTLTYERPFAAGAPDVIKLAFRSLNDFRPEAIGRQVEPLRALIDERGGLSAAHDPAPEEDKPDGDDAATDPGAAGGGSLLDQILGQAEPVTPGRGRASPRLRLIDAEIAQYLDAILHHEKFQRLEAAWRGLDYLVASGETIEQVKFRMLAVGKTELLREFQSAPSFEQSRLYREIFTDAFVSPGGEPYAAMICDFAFSARPDDLELLECLACVAAMAHAPLLTAAAPRLIEPDWDDFSGLAQHRSFVRHFESPVYTKWRSLRDNDDSRYVFLTLPRVLGRPAYGLATTPVAGLDYVERVDRGNDWLWMNAAWALATRLVAAFASDGWCAAVEGDAGGRVEGLPRVAGSDAGPMEVDLVDTVPIEFKDLGLAALQPDRPDGAYFPAVPSLQKPTLYHRQAASEGARLTARLPHVMACARIAHYLMAITVANRGRVGTTAGIAELLNGWLGNYTAPDGEATDPRRPLAHAEVEVQAADRGSPAVVVAYLTPKHRVGAPAQPFPIAFHLPFDL